MSTEGRPSNKETISQQRQDLLKDLMLRLHRGESKDIIQEEFNQNFDQVTAYEIQLMERNLMNEGISIEDIMRLCTIHANLLRTSISQQVEPEDFNKPGHPVHVIRTENLALRGVVDRIERLLKAYLETGEDSLYRGLMRQVDLLGQFEHHYIRKEYAIFPIMEKKGITAPPQVMWGVHDQIRDYFAEFLVEAQAQNVEESMEKFHILKEELLEMIVKEEDILIPMILDAFHEDDWALIAKELVQYGYTIVRPEKEWLPLIQEREENQYKAVSQQGDIILDTGSLSVKELNLILNILPMELSFVDANNIVKYYNEGDGSEKVFKRMKSAIGRDMISCHPPRTHEMVKTLVEQLRTGQKEKESMWFEMHNKFIHVTYQAVRDEDGRYMGVLEYVQDILPFLKIESEKRTLS